MYKWGVLVLDRSISTFTHLFLHGYFIYKDGCVLAFRHTGNNEAGLIVPFFLLKHAHISSLLLWIKYQYAIFLLVCLVKNSRACIDSMECIDSLNNDIYNPTIHHTFLAKLKLPDAAGSVVSDKIVFFPPVLSLCGNRS